MEMTQTLVARLADAARETGRLGLDTEFMPEGRYRPLLCLVQIVVGEEVAILDLLFRRRGIGVVMALHGAGPVISVVTDPGIIGTAVHGRTIAETDGGGRLLRAEVRLPVRLTINTPGGVREAGIGMAEVIAAHEFVHALGHEPHNSHLMTQTMHKVMGDRPAGDKLQAEAALMPPLQLSDQSVEILKAIWG